MDDDDLAAIGVPMPAIKLGEYPDRMVDHHGHGWLIETPLDGAPVSGSGPAADRAVTYWRMGETDDGAPTRLTASFADLTGDLGPARPVRQPPDKERDKLFQALILARYQALATVTAVLLQVLRDHGRDLVVAGRPGSWEADSVPEWAYTVGPDIVAARVHVEAYSIIHKVLRTWVTHPKRHHEVCETLLGIMGRVVDEQGGWHQIADTQLRPHMLEGEDLEHAVQLWAGTSRWYGTVEEEAWRRAETAIEARQQDLGRDLTFQERLALRQQISDRVLTTLAAGRRLKDV
ncbi:MAG: hypothetical protein J2P26_12435 [Nocardiopsaceae bacterium]|nr:hypothetical protein [Nocardiopsaceae bacterium]